MTSVKHLDSRMASIEIRGHSGEGAVALGSHIQYMGIWGIQ
jgi:hypothetical protein